MIRVAAFDNGSFIDIDSGKFDDWCVYFFRPGMKQRCAPKDFDYFSFLINLSSKVGKEKIYNDFVNIYSFSDNEIRYENVLKIYSEISPSYGNDWFEVCFAFIILYSTMVAEENKKNKILGKRIKRLAMYQLFVENLDVNYVVNFSKGVSWRILDKLCNERGF